MQFTKAVVKLLLVAGSMGASIPIMDLDHHSLGAQAVPDDKLQEHHYLGASTGEVPEDKILEHQSLGARAVPEDKLLVKQITEGGRDRGLTKCDQDCFTNSDGSHGINVKTMTVKDFCKPNIHTATWRRWYLEMCLINYCAHQSPEVKQATKNWRWDTCGY